MFTKRPFLTALAATTLIMLTAGCGGDPMASGGEPGAGSNPAIVIGSADFAESQLIATIYSHSLQNAGVEVEERLNIGSREVYLQALKDGSIDLLPEYNGYVLQALDPDAKATKREEIRTSLDAALPEGIIALDESDAENRNVLVVQPKVAQENNLKTISDLKPVAGELTLAGPAEWKTRDTGVPGLEKVYGLKFGSFQVFDAGGPLTLTAIQNGQADIGMLFSSDPVIQQEGLVPLEDDKSLFLAANILPLIRESKSSDDAKEALNNVSDSLSQEELMEMNGRVAAGDDINTIADEWIESNGL